MDGLYPALDKTFELLPIPNDWSDEQLRVLIAAMNQAYDKGQVDGMRFVQDKKSAS